MELGRRLAARELKPVYLLGPEETEWAEPLRKGVPEARLPLADPDAKLEMEPLLSIALAGRALACIANDSGGGHLMAASGAPLVSLFGPSSPAKFAPRVPDLTVIEGRTFGRAEMSAIPVEAVERAVADIRARGVAPHIPSTF
jgi:ADP-heptose:LPS heptosyltransferase